MRQLALVMRNELYLAGQQIWSQGVVKSGLIVIKQGVVELLSDEDDESPIIAFKEGTVGTVFIKRRSQMGTLIFN